MMLISDTDSAWIFKEIALKLYYAQDIKPMKSYDEIVCMLLDTEYGELVREASLDAIGIVFNLTRERVRQIGDSIVQDKICSNEGIEELYNDYVQYSRKNT